MPQHIKSSLSAAKAKSQALAKGVEEFTTVRCAAMSSRSTGRSAAAHDQNVSSLRSALVKYRSSQERASQALEQIAKGFDSTDRAAAAQLLGFVAY